MTWLHAHEQDASSHGYNWPMYSLMSQLHFSEMAIAWKCQNFCKQNRRKQIFKLMKLCLFSIILIDWKFICLIAVLPRYMLMSGLFTTFIRICCILQNKMCVVCVDRKNRISASAILFFSLFLPLNGVLIMNRMFAQCLLINDDK